MLKYTGHPFIDVGVATIVAFAGKRDPGIDTPEDVTDSDLVEIGGYLEERLSTKSKAQIFLSANYLASGFSNPSLQDAKYASQKADYANRMLRAYRLGTPLIEGRLCAFCGESAVYIASRGQVPLLNGETVINFGPQGQPGQPICGYCLLAVHALPLGAIKSGGRLLVVHTDQPEWTLRFARRALERNLQTLHMMDMGSIEEWPNLSYPKTRLVEALLELQSQGERQKMNSVVAYHFTNYGPKPAIDIFELPSSVVTFVREVESDYYPDRKQAWHRALQLGWVDPQQSRRNKQGTAPDSGGPEAWRNVLYDDLFNLPSKAILFFKRHIWPTHNWKLAELFLRKVMNMDEDRLKLLYELGTRFAAYTLERRSFYFEFGRENNYSTWRRKLLRAADDYARQHKQLLVTAEEFVQAFTAPRGAEFNDWKLARDIVMLRIIEERLRRGDVLSDEEELVPEGEEAETPSSEI